MSVGLILDEMPAGCMTCPLCHLSVNYNARMCGAAKLEMAAERGAHERRDDCPLQEVEPVRHGIWYDKKASFGDYFYKVCSVCGDERYMESIYPDEAGYNYCPNCGAKMDGDAT